jgi:hypothetical protein
MMTLGELERRAYISGDTKMTAVLGAAIDLSLLAMDGQDTDVRDEAEDIERELHHALHPIPLSHQWMDHLI